MSGTTQPMPARARTTPLSALEYWGRAQFNSANLIFEQATFSPYNNIELSILPNDSCLDIRKSKQTTCIFRDIVLSLTQQKAVLTFILSHSISFPFILFIQLISFYFYSSRKLKEFKEIFPFYILYPTLDWQRKWGPGLLLAWQHCLWSDFSTQRQ